MLVGNITEFDRTALIERRGESVGQIHRHRIEPVRSNSVPEERSREGFTLARSLANIGREGCEIALEHSGRWYIAGVKSRIGPLDRSLISAEEK